MYWHCAWKAEKHTAKRESSGNLVPKEGALEAFWVAWVSSVGGAAKSVRTYHSPGSSAS